MSVLPRCLLVVFVAALGCDSTPPPEAHDEPTSALATEPDEPRASALVPLYPALVDDENSELPAYGIYDWPEPQMPVMVHVESGLFFLDPFGEIRRVYRWHGDHERSRDLQGAERIAIHDLNGSGAMHVIFLDEPLRVIDAYGEPIDHGSFPGAACWRVVPTLLVEPRSHLICTRRSGRLQVFLPDENRHWEGDLGSRVQACMLMNSEEELGVELHCLLDPSEAGEPAGVFHVTLADHELSRGPEVTEADHPLKTQDVLETLDTPEPIPLATDPKPLRVEGLGACQVEVAGEYQQAIRLVCPDGEKRLKAHRDRPVQSLLVKDLNTDIRSDPSPHVIALTSNSLFIISGSGRTWRTRRMNTRDYSGPVSDGRPRDFPYHAVHATLHAHRQAVRIASTFYDPPMFPVKLPCDPGDESSWIPVDNKGEIDTILATMVPVLNRESPIQRSNSQHPDPHVAPPSTDSCELNIEKQCAPLDTQGTEGQLLKVSWNPNGSQAVACDDQEARAEGRYCCEDGNLGAGDQAVHDITIQMLVSPDFETIHASWRSIYIPNRFPNALPNGFPKHRDRVVQYLRDPAGGLVIDSLSEMYRDGLGQKGWSADERVYFVIEDGALNPVRFANPDGSERRWGVH